MRPEWTAIGTGLFCPVVVSPQPGRVALFTRSATGALFHQEKDDSGWGPRPSLGVPVARSKGSELDVPVDWQLAACGGEANEIDLVARSPDGDLLHMAWTSEGWGAFECVGAPATVPANVAIPVGLASPPAVCRSEPGRIDVFALGQSGEVLHAVKNGEGWGPFDSLGVPPARLAGDGQTAPGAEAVAACSCGPSRIAVFRRGARGDLLLKWWNGTRWSEYASLGSPEIPDESYPAVTVPARLTGPPAACSWGPTRLDAFARGPSGELAHTWWDGSDWSGFDSVGLPLAEDHVIPLTGVVAVCSSGVNSCDVVAGAVDGRLYHATLI